MCDGETAVEHLKRGSVKLTGNTDYTLEGPLVETPLMFVRSIQDLVLQSWSGLIRVFPAIPKEWPDVAIHNMRAEGNFAVSAVRKGGQTQFIHLTSNAGEPCRVRTDPARPIEAVGARPIQIKAIDALVIELDLRKGESVLLRTKGTTPDTKIAPVAAAGIVNYWGSGNKK